MLSSGTGRRRIPPNPPTPDGRAEKRFPCRPVRGWPLGALARAFGEFAPRADSGLREASRADADGGEPEPTNHAKIALARASGHREIVPCCHVGREIRAVQSLGCRPTRIQRGMIPGRGPGFLCVNRVFFNLRPVEPLKTLTFPTPNMGGRRQNAISLDFLPDRKLTGGCPSPEELCL